MQQLNCWWIILVREKGWGDQTNVTVEIDGYCTEMSINMTDNINKLVFNWFIKGFLSLRGWQRKKFREMN